MNSDQRAGPYSPLTEQEAYLANGQLLAFIRAVDLGGVFASLGAAVTAVGAELAKPLNDAAIAFAKACGEIDTHEGKPCKKRKRNARR